MVATMPESTENSASPAVIGVADHAGWAVVVTVVDRSLVDRRRIELVDEGLPNLPHHHDAQELPIDQGVELVEKVRASVVKCATREFAKLAREISHPVAGVALRAYRQALPNTVAERIANYKAQCAADSIMYRDELARVAEEMGWFVHWYDAKNVVSEPLRTLIDRTGKSLGPPFTRDHRNAMAAALHASTTRPQ